MLDWPLTQLNAIVIPQQQAQPSAGPVAKIKADPLLGVCPRLC